MYFVYFVHFVRWSSAELALVGGLPLEDRSSTHPCGLRTTTLFNTWKPCRMKYFFRIFYLIHFITTLFNTRKHRRMKYLFVFHLIRFWCSDERFHYGNWTWFQFYFSFEPYVSWNSHHCIHFQHKYLFSRDIRPNCLIDSANYLFSAWSYLKRMTGRHLWLTRSCVFCPKTGSRPPCIHRIATNDHHNVITDQQ